MTSFSKKSCVDCIMPMCFENYRRTLVSFVFLLLPNMRYSNSINSLSEQLSALLPFSKIPMKFYEFSGRCRYEQNVCKFLVLRNCPASKYIINTSNLFYYNSMFPFLISNQKQIFINCIHSTMNKNVIFKILMRWSVCSG